MDTNNHPHLQAIWSDQLTSPHFCMFLNCVNKQRELNSRLSHCKAKVLTTAARKESKFAPRHSHEYNCTNIGAYLLQPQYHNALDISYWASADTTGLFVCVGVYFTLMQLSSLTRDSSYFPKVYPFPLSSPNVNEYFPVSSQQGRRETNFSTLHFGRGVEKG